MFHVEHWLGVLLPPLESSWAGLRLLIPAAQGMDKIGFQKCSTWNICPIAI